MGSLCRDKRGQQTCVERLKPAEGGIRHRTRVTIRWESTRLQNQRRPGPRYKYLMEIDRELEWPFRGWLDQVRNRTVIGWAYDCERPGRRLVVSICVNSQPAGIALANLPRPDVAAAGFGDGFSGFRFVVPETIERIHSVRVSVVDAGRDLISSTDSVCQRTNGPIPAEWRADGHLCLPSFFLLGAAKSATTSLYFYLSQHPEICMADPKEPLYFEAEFDCGLAYYFNRYFSHWRGERIVGEARHRNLYLPYVAGRIFAYNPRAKLLAILRNPVVRAVSHWWHGYSRNIERSSFRDAIAADWHRISGGFRMETPSERELHSQVLNLEGRVPFRTYVDSGYYDEQLQRYIDLFGRESLHIVLFEDLARNPADVMAGIFRFLGADSKFATSLNYTKANISTPGALQQVDSATLEWLRAHYRSHNRRLESLMNLSLDAWEFPSL